MWPAGVLGYLLASGHPGLAEQVLQTCLDKRPGLRRDFTEQYLRFRDRGLPAEGTTCDAEGLAVFALATGMAFAGE